MPHINNEGDDPSTDGNFDPHIDEDKEGQEMHSFLGQDLPELAVLATVLLTERLAHRG